ncbi:MAG: amino acid adenylation domain-containing protein [Spirochaetaceae bacterium]|nr:MAG: amino acid adenylation domain-containing protein [Spirochaetaceae bacterium]
MGVDLNNLSAQKKALLSLAMQRAAKGKDSGFAIPRMGLPASGKYFPLSFAQKRFWFLDQYLEDRSVNNSKMCFLIKGRPDLKIMEAAFQKIVEKHEILGMCYATIDEEPVMFRRDDTRVNIRKLKLNGFSKGKKESCLNALIETLAKTNIDISRDLPFHVSIVSKSRGEWVLVIIMHHIVSDAWSFRILLDEFRAYYSAYSRGEEPAVKEPSIQYYDYADWQNRRLSSDRIGSLSGYWKKTLEGAPSSLNLMTDFPRPALQTHHGAVRNFKIPEATLEKIERFSKERQITPFAITLAAFVIMLYRYTGQDDILVGIPFANRNRREIQSLIGLFLNTLVIRTEFRESVKIGEILGMIKERILGAFSHSDYPFEKLIDDLKIERSLRHPPLFQVMFNYHNMSSLDLDLDGMAIEKLRSPSEHSKFDLELSIRNMKNGTRGMITYNTDLFAEDSIIRMGGHYNNVLSEMLDNPEMAVNEIHMLRQEEIVSFQPVQSSDSADEGFPYLHKEFERSVLEIPDAVAVTCGNEKLTYRELNARANKIARFLISRGVVPEVRIGILMDRSVDLVVMILAVAKAGGVFIPLDPMYPAERISLIIDDAEAAYLITDDAIADQVSLSSDTRIFTVEELYDVASTESGENPASYVTQSSLLYIIYTSGTTGKPKGVAVEHGNYIAYLQGIWEKMRLPHGLNFAIISTFAADLGSIMMWGALSYRGTLHIIPYEQSLDPESVARVFLQKEIDVIKLVPTHFDALLKASHPVHVLPRQLLVLAGEPCMWDLIDKVRAINRDQRIMINYGPTETTVSSHGYEVPADRPVQHTSVVPIGFPTKNVISIVLDSHGNQVPRGVPGELYIGGPVVARGYLGQPELTEKKFVMIRGNRFYRTGDLVRLLEQGEIEFLGRMDDQVKISGFRIELDDVAGALAELPEIEDAVVIVKEGPSGEKSLVAFVVPDSRHMDTSREQVLGRLKEKLPHYMIPKALVFIDRIPFTPNGKLDRTALLSIPAELGTPVHEYVEPCNATEESIAGVWKIVLELDRVGIDDNFFFMGGDSFKAIRMVNLLKKEKISLRVVDIFQYSTIRELAGFAGENNAVARGFLNELTPQRTGEKEITSLVCIPYPAGDPIMFQKLADTLPGHCSLFAYEFPGRGDGEMQVSLQESARLCVDEIKEKINGPLIVYGHCMGGAFATEIACLLEQENVKVSALFLGAIFPATRLPGGFFKLWNKIFPTDRGRSDRDLLDMMRRTGGISADITKEEQEYLLKYMRFYSRESDNYYHDAFSRESFVKLKAPIVSIVGDMDRLTNFYEERYLDWKFFSSSVHLEVIPEAGHFFHIHQPEIVLDLVDKYTGIITMGRELSSTSEPVEQAVAEPTEEASVVSDEAIKKEEAKNIRSFIAIALGQFVSMFGSSLSGFALGIYILQLKGSILDFSLVLLFNRLPQILIMPVVGWVVDKYDRRKLMLVSDLFVALRIAILLVLITNNSLELWHVFVTTTLGSIARAFRNNAYVAAVPQLVPKRYLANANGFVQLTNNTGDILAPLCAGFFLTFMTIHTIMIIDLVTFGVAFLPLLIIKFPNRMIRQIEESIGKAIAGGFKFIVKRKSMIIMVVYFFIANIFLGIGTTLLTPLVLSFSDPTILWIITSFTGVGTIAGALLVSLWGGMKRRAEGMIGFNIMIGLGYVMMGIAPHPIFPIIGVLLFRIGLTLVVVHWQSIIQVKVGWELQGRVFAMNELLARISTPLGIFLGGFLTEFYLEPFMSGTSELARTLGTLIGSGPGRGIALLLIIVGLGRGLMGYLGLKIKSFRYMEDKLPDIAHGASITRDKDKYQDIVDREYECGNAGK